MPRVFIEGVGFVELPDDATPQEIDEIVNRDFGKAQSQPQTFTDKVKSVLPFGPPAQQAPAGQSYMPDMGAVLSQAGMGAEYPLTYGQIPAEEVKGGMNQSREYAPFAGAVIGGLGGAATRIPGASTFGSGAGFATGEAVKEGAIPTADQFVQNFGKGVASDIGGNLAAAGVAKVLGYGWKWGTSTYNKLKDGFSELNQAAVKLQQKGLPLPANLIRPSAKGDELAELARSTAPGNAVVAKAHEKISQGANEMLGEFQTTWGLNKYSKETAAKAFDDWAAHMGGGESPVHLPETAKFIEETLAKPFATVEKKPFWQTTVASFNENPTVQGVRDLWATLNIKGKGVEGVDKTARVRLAELIAKDLKEQYDDTAAKLLESAKNENNWFKKTSAFKSLVQGSYSRSGQSEVFLPDAFARKWESIKRTPKVFTRFSEGEIAEIDEFAEMMGLIGGELKNKVSTKTLTDQLSEPNKINKFLYMAGLPKLAQFMPNLTPVTSMRAGKIYQPESGLYQNMIGESTKAEALPGLVNIGGKMAILKALQEKQRQGGGGGW